MGFNICQHFLAKKTFPLPTFYHLIFSVGHKYSWKCKIIPVRRNVLSDNNICFRVNIAVCVIHKRVLATVGGADYTIVHKSLTNLFLIGRTKLFHMIKLITIISDSLHFSVFIVY